MPIAHHRALHALSKRNVQHHFSGLQFYQYLLKFIHFEKFFLR
ncbi:hypothetical protein HMPREF3190_01545 [Umbribacter vaginalis]|nr:hypothetical protein HMPREF3190_01545 [Coriobacteriales bacterium DNF00809]